MALAVSQQNWSVLYELVQKDFKVRYRNMSLGIFWSLVNPLILMTVLTFVFTVLFETQRPNFSLFVLMGLLPYNFTTLAWTTGTNSIVDNAPILKKVPFVREWVPVSVVLGNAVHYLIQLGLLLAASAVVVGPNWGWLWMPFVVVLHVVFVCGLTLLSASLDVYYRDVRYVVESAGIVLFWLVPIFYGFDQIGSGYIWLYEYNPIAAVVLIIRRLLLYGDGPGLTLWKLALVSVFTLALGYVVFRRIKKDFSDYL